MDVNNLPILSAKGISKRFGGVRALIEANFDCYEGEVHALIGENGAGKSTLVKILCGVVSPDSGSVWLRGKEIKLASPITATRLGIASVFQELSLLPELTVAENIYLGCEPRNRLGFIDSRKLFMQAEKIISDLQFDIDVRTLVKDLPLAQQQLVEIAKSLSKNPDIIILDEATSALGAKEVDMLFGLVRKLTREQNKTVVFISHKMNELEQIADRATIYRDAHFITSFKWGEKTNSEIIDLIAGRKIDTVFPEKIEATSDEVALEIKNVYYDKNLKNVSLKIKKGEIFGLAGLSGHGQTDLLGVIYGSKKADRGSIIVNGKVERIVNPRVGLSKRIALTPADRKTDGLLMTRSAGENIALTTLKRRSVCGIINRKQENSDIARIIELLQIKLSSPKQISGTLSGGNQQKLVLGKAILTDADILLLSDPTRGIDVGTKYEIYQLINKLVKSGKTIVLYSTENNELLGLCNRTAVFKQGEISAVLEGENFTEREILKAALGIEETEVIA